MLNRVRAAMHTKPPALREPLGRRASIPDWQSSPLGETLQYLAMIDDAPAPSAPVACLTAGLRAISLIEFLIGGAIVIGHNVFHVVPNEVPILFVLGIVSIRLREGSFRALGLGRPKSWWLTILIAVVTAAIVIAVGQFVTDPLAKTLGLEATHAVKKEFGSIKGDIWVAAEYLGLVWTFAAFGEEIGYRRYLIGRAADIGNRSPIAYTLALVAVSVLFGFGHFYQGPAGIFTTACDGFMIGTAYLLARRNLWVAVLAHGLIDTFAIAILFLGLAD
ncbi:MAG: CPBP family intramembrane metalloprotease [Proteobacteria bacterium]|nr:CPBP family intramembrane metalloprotease [Pseudomonadota bacterium]